MNKLRICALITALSTFYFKSSISYYEEYFDSPEMRIMNSVKQENYQLRLELCSIKEALNLIEKSVRILLEDSEIRTERTTSILNSLMKEVSKITHP